MKEQMEEQTYLQLEGELVGTVCFTHGEGLVAKRCTRGPMRGIIYGQCPAPKCRTKIYREW